MPTSYRPAAHRRADADRGALHAWCRASSCASAFGRSGEIPIEHVEIGIDVTRHPLQPERLEQPPQMSSDPRISVHIDRLVTRQPGIEPLKLGFDRRRTPDQAELRFAQQTGAAEIGNVAKDQIMETAAPCAFAITIVKKLPTAGHRRARTHSP